MIVLCEFKECGYWCDVDGTGYCTNKVLNIRANGVCGYRFMGSGAENPTLREVLDDDMRELPVFEEVCSDTDEMGVEPPLNSEGEFSAEEAKVDESASKKS